MQMLTARLFFGIMCARKEDYDIVVKKLEKLYGEVDEQSAWYYFDFTNYYQKEFGKKLCKRFVFFKAPIKRTELPKIKQQSIKLENDFREKGNRRINIDPGYLTNHHVVVASTKELPHRIYLGQGIFGDLQMILAKKQAYIFKHTFADYNENKDLFLRIRNK